MSFDVLKVRGDFPELSLTPRGKRLTYLDSAATALKPRQVILALDHFYRFEAANVHRGAHYLSDRATEKFEAARGKIRDFLGAESVEQIVFTKGTTESVNLVAQSFTKQFMRPGDEILLTEMEHHSNLVPWQMAAAERGLKLRFVKVTASGELDMGTFREQLSSKTKMVAVTHCSNALGTVNPISEISRAAHAVGAKVFLDAAQSVSFLPIRVRDLGVDFLAFSGHKLYGPYGFGVLYGDLALLNEMPPYQGGGSMIDRVTLEKTTFLAAPQRFEAGTPNISGAIATAAAIEFLGQFSIESIAAHEHALLQEAEAGICEIPGVKVVGQSKSRVNILSFVIEGHHPSDVGQILDQQGVAVRAGHHCTQPLMDTLGLPGTVRASFGIYNNQDDVRAFVAAVKKAKEILG